MKVVCGLTRFLNPEKIRFGGDQGLLRDLEETEKNTST